MTNPTAKYSCPDVAEVFPLTRIGKSSGYKYEFFSRENGFVLNDDGKAGFFHNEYSWDETYPAPPEATVELRLVAGDGKEIPRIADPSEWNRYLIIGQRTPDQAFAITVAVSGESRGHDVGEFHDDILGGCYSLKPGTVTTILFGNKGDKPSDRILSCVIEEPPKFQPRWICHGLQCFEEKGCLRLLPSRPGEPIELNEEEQVEELRKACDEFLAIRSVDVKIEEPPKFPCTLPSGVYVDRFQGQSCGFYRLSSAATKADLEAAVAHIRSVEGGAR